MKQKLLRLSCGCLLMLGAAACTLVPATRVPTQSPPTLTNTPVPLGPPSVTPLPILATQTAAACTIPPGWSPYTVQVGDSLTTIAQRIGSTVDALRDGNCLPNADQIFVGQTIYLPVVLNPTG
jgi:hypothetical protein